MLCKNCGKELADSALMCPNCGAPTENWQKMMPVVPASAPAETKTAEPAVSETTPQSAPAPAATIPAAPAPATPAPIAQAPAASATSFRIPGQPNYDNNGFRPPVQKRFRKASSPVKEPLTLIGFILSVIAFACGFILITCTLAIGGIGGFLSGALFLSAFTLIPTFAGFVLDLYGLLTAKSRLGKALAIVGTVLTAVIIFYFFLGLILGFTA